MLHNSNLTQSNKQNPTRREVLKGLATIPLIAAVPLSPIGEYSPTLPAPYGPPERTAILDQWLGRIDEVMAGLSEYRRIIVEARALAPGQVDGVELVNLESEAHRLADDLVGWIDCDYENDLISNATGRSSSAVCVEAELTSDEVARRGHSHVFDRDFWQREVDAVSEDHPHERARLQALLNAKYAGVL